VALQFPDDLLAMSVTVVQLLQQLTAAEIVILADTSYGRWNACYFVPINEVIFVIC